MNDGREMIVSFRYNNQIRILDQDGEEEWTSSDKFGGNPIYLEIPPEWDEIYDKPKEKDQMKRYFLFHRIHVVDLDRDGKNEIDHMYTVEQKIAFQKSQIMA